mmetsp:Transcript_21109/g.31101  ORF Transcript_21109/g.31101 Transcript_21109/m.31101 type:complete len:82 (-) Transcript_21109:478-723(-)
MIGIRCLVHLRLITKPIKILKTETPATAAPTTIMKVVLGLKGIDNISSDKPSARLAKKLRRREQVPIICGSIIYKRVNKNR